MKHSCNINTKDGCRVGVGRGQCGENIHMTNHSQHSDEDDESHGEVGSVGLGLYIRVPHLVDLQHGQARNDVHEGSVCKHITEQTTAMNGPFHTLGKSSDNSNSREWTISHSRQVIRQQP